MNADTHFDAPEATPTALKAAIIRLTLRLEEAIARAEAAIARTGRPWCECKTDNGRWAPWPMPFCRR